MFLVPWPEVPLRWLPGYGLAFGTLQFLFLSWEMAAGMAAGLASPVLLGGVIVVTGVRPVRCQGRVRVALACSARLASSSSGG